MPRTGERVGYYRCRTCGGEFTVRTGTIFARSHVSLEKWIYAMYLEIMRKGISSLQLSKEIGVTQKTAWFMLGKLREACVDDFDQLQGKEEEAYNARREEKESSTKKLDQERGAVGSGAEGDVRRSATYKELTG